jgi:hypothetical protein
MTAVAAPFGFQPVFHPTGFDRGILRTIASGYGTAIYKGSPVILDTNGTIVIGTAAADLLGIFAGVEYTDPSGKPNWSPYWPAGQTVFAGTSPKAYVWEDPATVFAVQANGPIAQSAIGSQADVVNPGAGSALTGLSSAALGAAVAGGAQAQFRIYGFQLTEDNAPGDAFTVVQVQLARSQFIANKVAV